MLRRCFTRLRLCLQWWRPTTISNWYGIEILSPWHWTKATAHKLQNKSSASIIYHCHFHLRTRNDILKFKSWSFSVCFGCCESDMHTFLSVRCKRKCVLFLHHSLQIEWNKWALVHHTIVGLLAHYIVVFFVCCAHNPICIFDLAHFKFGKMQICYTYTRNYLHKWWSGALTRLHDNAKCKR